MPKPLYHSSSTQERAASALVNDQWTSEVVRRLGAWAMLIGLADMSETAWRQRLRKASAWLLWLLGELLAAPVEAQTSWLHGRTPGRVLLVDATRKPRNGPAGPGVAGAHGL